MTRSFHWHIRGHHFRDYHLLRDEQADQIFAMMDEIAERARKLGGTTLRSISDIPVHVRACSLTARSVNRREGADEKAPSSPSSPRI
jgi:starvation-inducible DNA-binding protein